MNSALLAFVSASVFLTNGASVFAAGENKTRYTLFNPTPDHLMREMSPDRPDRTEGPNTIDAGHLQLEIDFINLTRNRDTNDGANTKTWAYDIAPVNIRVGLRNSLELSVVVETYKYSRTRDYDAGAREKKNGFGDITTSLKYNFWGNDGGQTALAVIPFVKIPANNDLGNDSVEGGVIVPLVVDLGAGWSAGVMTEIDIISDEAGSGYHPEYVNSIVFGKSVTGKLGVYTELFTSKSAENGADWANTFDLGMTYGMSENVVFDIGVNLGVTDAADDMNSFAGFSYRF